MKAGSHLEKVLERGGFAVTAELLPPEGNNVDSLKKKAELLRGVVDSVNAPDNPSAVVRMSSLATGTLLAQIGIEPVVHIGTRDRNRIAIQSDLFGATALGVKNVLCLTGDHPCFGNQIESKNVYDLDSVQLIDCLRNLRDHQTLLGRQEKIKDQVDLFIGATANPFADPIELHVLHLAKKIQAGADFIQTECIYDMSRFKEWMKRVCDRGLLQKTYLLAGVSPLRSGNPTQLLRRNTLSLQIPDSVLTRLTKAKDPEKEGVSLCLEQIFELKEMEGIRGIHVMGMEYEPDVRQIVEKAGLLPRPGIA